MKKMKFYGMKKYGKKEIKRKVKFYGKKYVNYIEGTTKNFMIILMYDF